MGDDDTSVSTQIAEVRAALAVQTELRRRAERGAADRTLVLAAIGSVERDRDAMTSPEVDDLRTQVTDLVQRLADAHASVDRTRVMVARVSAGGFDVRRDDTLRPGRRLLELFATDAADRQQDADTLQAAGLGWVRVPDVARHAPPDAGTTHLAEDHDGSR